MVSRQWAMVPCAAGAAAQAIEHGGGICCAGLSYHIAANGSAQSGRRESNPRSKLGKLVFCL